MAETTLDTLFKQGYTKARGLKENYDASKYANIIYFCTDTLEIIVDGKNYGGDLVTIRQNFLDSYDPSTADTYILEKHTEDDILLLTFTPLSPDTLKVPKQIGDIKQGMTAAELKGRALSHILDDIIFETIYPTVTNPTLTISGGNATVKAGSTVFMGNGYTFNKGKVTVDDGGATPAKDYVGEASNPVYTVTVTPGAKNTDASVAAYPAVGSNVAASTVTRYEPGSYAYKVTVNYAEGPIMQTSKGATPNPMPTTNANEVDNPHNASTLTCSNTVTYTVTLPVWIDTLNNSGYVEQGLKAWGAMTFSAVAMKDTTAASPIKIKTPRKIKSINAFNTLSGKYDIPYLSSFGNAGQPNEIEETINNKEYPYFEYIWTGSALGAVNMEIQTY